MKTQILILLTVSILAWLIKSVDSVAVQEVPRKNDSTVLNYSASSESNVLYSKVVSNDFLSPGYSQIVVKLESGVELYGVIDSQGNEILPPNYDIMTPFNYKDEFDLAFIAYTEGHKKSEPDVELKYKFGCINKKGEIVIPVIYDYIHSVVKEDRIIAEYNNRYGILDKTGNVVAPFIYQSIYPYNEGLAIVTRNNKEGYVNTAGEEVIQPQYDHAVVFGANSPEFTFVCPVYKEVSEKTEYEGMNYERPDYILYQYEVITRNGDSLFKSDIILTKNDDLISEDFPELYDEGKGVLVFKFKSSQKVKMDINGYYGKVNKDLWVYEQYEEEPIYEMYEWDKETPYEFIAISELKEALEEQKAAKKEDEKP